MKQITIHGKNNIHKCLKANLDENSEVYIKKLFGELSFSFTAKQMAILNGATYQSNFICKKKVGDSFMTGYVPMKIRLLISNLASTNGQKSEGWRTKTTPSNSP